MAQFDYTVDINLGGNELLKHRVENLATDPVDIFEGRLYFNTNSNKLRIYANQAWGDVAEEFKVYNGVTTAIGTGLYRHDGSEDFTLPEATGSGNRIFVLQTGSKEEIPGTNATYGTTTLAGIPTGATYSVNNWDAVITNIDIGQDISDITIEDFSWSVVEGSGGGNPPLYSLRLRSDSDIIWESGTYGMGDAMTEYVGEVVPKGERLTLEVSVTKQPSGPLPGRPLKVLFGPSNVTNLGTGDATEPYIKFVTLTSPYTPTTKYITAGQSVINNNELVELTDSQYKPLIFIDVDTDQWSLAPYKPITPSDIGLGNVNNTKDINKPISTATYQELNSLDERISNLEDEPDNADLNKSVIIGAQSSTWTYTHSMGNKRPSVSTYDVSGAKIYGSESWSGKTITIKFNSPISGRIDLN